MELALRKLEKNTDNTINRHSQSQLRKTGPGLPATHRSYRLLTHEKLLTRLWRIYLLTITDLLVEKLCKTNMLTARWMNE